MLTAILTFATVALTVTAWVCTCNLLAWLFSGCGRAERRAAREREVARKAEIRRHYEEAGVEYHG